MTTLVLVSFFVKFPGDTLPETNCQSTWKWRVTIVGIFASFWNFAYFQGMLLQIMLFFGCKGLGRRHLTREMAWNCLHNCSNLGGDINGDPGPVSRMFKRLLFSYINCRPWIIKWWKNPPIPSWKLAYSTLGIGKNHLQNTFRKRYVGSHEGNSNPKNSRWGLSSHMKRHQMLDQFTFALPPFFEGFKYQLSTILSIQSCFTVHVSFWPLQPGRWVTSNQKRSSALPHCSTNIL